MVEYHSEIALKLTQKVKSDPQRLPGTCHTDL